MAQGIRGNALVPLQSVNGIDQRNEGASDRCSARTAISLNHITVQGDGVLTEFGEINRRPQRSTDETLDFQRAPTLLAPRGLAAHA